MLLMHTELLDWIQELNPFANEQPAAEETTASTPEEKEDCQVGGTARQNGHQPLQVQPVFNENGLYMEKQLQKFCQIHALDALLGRTVVQPMHILNFCKAHASDNTHLGSNLRHQAPSRGTSAT